MSMTTLLVAGMLMTPKISFEARAKDWRFGPVVYQIFVDRFAPSASLEAKRNLYRAPRLLRDWTDLPTQGRFDDTAGCWSHEMHFWGGDLRSTEAKLDYVQKLGANVVYLLPIHDALTNHKYDATNYKVIAPEYGTEADFLSLIGSVHSKGMRIMLDGVFNHMGRSAPTFQKAFSNPKDPRRDWFYFGKEYKNGYRGYAGVGNMPSLHLENPSLQQYLWEKPDSVVQSALKKGVDGWRLDVAFDLGHEVLAKITRAAKRAKPESVVVGEISGYPSDWEAAVDGVFNFFAINTCHEMVDGKIGGGRVGRMLDTMVTDAGIEPILRSWLLLDNHDTSRVADTIPDIKKRRLVQLLQMTLPGSPVIYYGSELGMRGAGDPQNRAPMRWDLVNDASPDLAWTRQLTQIRKEHPALRYGDFRALESDRLLAFVRSTDKFRDNVIVVVNPTTETVRETFPSRIGRFQSWGEARDVLGSPKIRSITGLLQVEVPPQSARIYVPITDPSNGYSSYDRIR
ncbi:MAG: glycoside hydrolase family 13 protein [Fimbriimonas sp.]